MLESASSMMLLCAVKSFSNSSTSIGMPRHARNMCSVIGHSLQPWMNLVACSRIDVWYSLPVNLATIGMAPIRHRCCRNSACLRVTWLISCSATSITCGFCLLDGTVSTRSSTGMMAMLATRWRSSSGFSCKISPSFLHASMTLAGVESRRFSTVIKSCASLNSAR